MNAVAEQLVIAGEYIASHAEELAGENKLILAEEGFELRVLFSSSKVPIVIVTKEYLAMDNPFIRGGNDTLQPEKVTTQDCEAVTTRTCKLESGEAALTGYEWKCGMCGELFSTQVEPTYCPNCGERW